MFVSRGLSGERLGAQAEGGKSRMGNGGKQRA